MKAQLPLFLMLVALLSFGCAEKEPQPVKNESNENKSDLIALSKNITENEKVTLVISESHFGEIALPFPQNEMIDSLRTSFTQYSVTKEIGQQDGPDFTLYSIQSDVQELAYFEMDWENRLKLNAVYIKAPIIKDEYGLSVGDDYQKIKKHRKGALQLISDYHSHTYVYIAGSNIKYEMVNGSPRPNQSDQLNKALTEEQLMEWRIKQIIWKN